MTDDGTVSMTVTVLIEGGGVASSAPIFEEEPLKKTRERLPAADPMSSVRFVRSTVNVKVAVAPGAMLSKPLCGISHGTSATRKPVKIAFPLLVKLTDPVGDDPTSPATSTRLAVGFAFTTPVGGRAENTFTGTCRRDGTDVASSRAAPSNTPLGSAFAVMVTA